MFQLNGACHIVRRNMAPMCQVVQFSRGSQESTFMLFLREETFF